MLGHLVAVHDGMLSLLGFREQLYPELTAAFITEPDNVSKEMPLIKDLRVYWKKVSAVLAEHRSNLQPDEWFQKHIAVSDENFIKQPHRNKLNIIIRTNHLSYHLVQLAFLKNKIP